MGGQQGPERRRRRRGGRGGRGNIPPSTSGRPGVRVGFDYYLFCYMRCCYCAELSRFLVAASVSRSCVSVCLFCICEYVSSVSISTACLFRLRTRHNIGERILLQRKGFCFVHTWSHPCKKQFIVDGLLLAVLSCFYWLERAVPALIQSIPPPPGTLLLSSLPSRAVDACEREPSWE